MISPCRNCKLELVDKNNETCMRCAKRIKYVASMEGLTCSLPVEMTDMAKWTKDQVDYLRQNYTTKSDLEIAKHIGKNPPCVQIKRTALGLKKRRGEWSFHTGWQQR